MVHHETGGTRREGVADPICAVATPSGQGGVAVVRVSGFGLKAIVEPVVGKLPKPRYAALRAFVDEGGELLDRGLVLYFPAPRSFTGEDVVELQCHGSPAVARALVTRLQRLGARLAGPGEFSERAFLNGRMDLTQAEGVAALIGAESDAARQAAMRSIEGVFGRRVDGLSDRLADLRARLEAHLDFPDETDVPEDTLSWLAAGIGAVQEELREVIARSESGRRVSGGARLALLGATNAGKSSLLNALSDQEAAIVSEEAGTTRDVVARHVMMAGRNVEVVDTAGLREEREAGAIEREGMRRALAAAEGADVVLLVVDSVEEPDWRGDGLPTAVAGSSARVICVRNKIDRSGEQPGWRERAEGETLWSCGVSATTGAGIVDLQQGLEEILKGDSGAEAWAAGDRHLEALRRAEVALAGARRSLDEGVGEEIAAESLRDAQSALGEVTGRVSHEELLGRVFSSFCVGK